MHLPPHWIFLSILVGLAALAITIALRKPAFPYHPTPLLTENETEFYGRLRQALPWALILPQTAMSALVQPHPRLSTKNKLSAFRRISQKRIDFVICHADLRVICVVELDDRTHNKKQDRRRDDILMSAGIRTLRYESRADLRPSPQTLRNDIHCLT